MSISLSDPDVLASAQAAKTELVEQVFGVLADAAGVGAPTNRLLDSIPVGSNIVGVGYGAKVTEGAVQGSPAVRVYVRQKLPQSALGTEIIPDNIAGIPTDVVPVGDIVAQVSCGVSVGHFLITAGTLGCLVVRRSAPTGDRFILSNNHVLANVNAASIGDDILQPGPIDGGKLPPIAHLTDFHPLDLTGLPNHIDAAIAQLVSSTSVTPDIAGSEKATIGGTLVSGIGLVKSPVPAKLYQSVRKHGRTTGQTLGIIMDVSADIKVRYGSNIALFEDQIAILGAGGVFSSGGDSGSLIVDAVTKEAVALLFAGGTNITFGNPIDLVLDHFKVDIV